jgi:hypothetical protein
MSPKSKNPFQTPAPIQFYEEMEDDSAFVKYNEDEVE